MGFFHNLKTGSIQQKKLGTRLHCPRAGPFCNNHIGEDTKNVPCAYQQFLVDSKLEQGDQVTFIFALEPFSIEKFNSKLDDLPGHLKYAAKVKVAFGFVMENNEGHMLSICLSSRKKMIVGEIQTVDYKGRLETF